MRIFHNKETNEVIVVYGKKATSIYCYQNDHIPSVAHAIVNELTTMQHKICPCEEIKLPAIEKTEKPKMQEHAFHLPEPKPKEIWEHNTKCEHSQTKNNSQSSITSTADSEQTTTTTSPPSTQPKQPKDGNQLETSQ